MRVIILKFIVVKSLKLNAQAKSDKIRIRCFGACLFIFILRKESQQFTYLKRQIA